MVYRTCSVIATIIFVIASAQAQTSRRQPLPNSNEYQRRFESLCISLRIKYEQALRDTAADPTLLNDLRLLVETCPQPQPFATLIADVKINSAKGGFADIGSSVELKPGVYTFRLNNSSVRYGRNQKISEAVLLRMNIETKDAYLTLNGIGDFKTIFVPVACTLSVFFAPGEPAYDDEGAALVEVYTGTCPSDQPLHRISASVIRNAVKGGFADFGKNVELQAGTYTFRLADSTVKYGEQQKVSEVALLRMNIESKDAYLTLNGIGDAKTITVPSDCTLSVFFAPGEPTSDDSGSVKVEVFRH